jgi:hypothetical protein
VENHILDKTAANIDVETNIKGTAGCKNEEQWQIIGTYIIKSKVEGYMMVSQQRERSVNKSRRVAISRGSTRLCVFKMLYINRIFFLLQE